MIYRPARQTTDSSQLLLYSVSYGIKGTHLAVISLTLSTPLAIFKNVQQQTPVITCTLRSREDGCGTRCGSLLSVWKCQKQLRTDILLNNIDICIRRFYMTKN